MFTVSWPARQEGPEGQVNRQAKLLGDATRQFSAIARPRSGEIDAYKDLFYQLIEFCGTPSRRLISASLASFAYTPLPIAIFLASDAAEVATPMLLFSPVIGESHIVRLAARLPREHLRVLCRRSDLSESSIKALMEHGCDESVEVLRANPALRNHAKLFVAPNRPAQRGTADANRPAVDNDAREVAAPEPKRETAAAELLRLANVGRKSGRMPGIAAPDAAPGLAFGRRLLLAARGRHPETVAALIAIQSGADADLVKKFVSSGNAEALLVFLKGLAVDNVTALQVLLLVQPQVGSDRREFSRLSHLYRKIDPAQCETVLRLLAEGGSSPGTVIERKMPDFAEAARNRRAAIAAMGLAPARQQPGRPGDRADPRERAIRVAQ